MTGRERRGRISLPSSYAVSKTTAVFPDALVTTEKDQDPKVDVFVALHSPGLSHRHR